LTNSKRLLYYWPVSKSLAPGGNRERGQNSASGISRKPNHKAIFGLPREKGKPKMTCIHCQHETARTFCKDRKGYQRYRCTTCAKTFTERSNGHLPGMYTTTEKAAEIIRLLVEGMSIRSVERITGTNRNTIMRLLESVGSGCERFLENHVRAVPVKDVQCDEMWGFVGCKEKRRVENSPVTFGDAYCFVGIERHTKLVLTWHLGRRTARDTMAFMEKLEAATSGHFQLTTDGFPAYPDAVSYSLGTRVDYAQLVKVYAASREGEQRYSPAEVVDAVPVPRIGRPDPARICTSHVERQNLTMRMCIRRLTRLTNAYSKKWENLKATLALYFAWYNFCRVHSTLRVTPAMESGLTNHVWGLTELLGATHI
jgi:transposase-like protein/IS1 family transposase